MVVSGPLRKSYSHCWSALNLSPGNAPSALWSSCPPELLWSSRHCDWGVLIMKEKVTLFYICLSFWFILCVKQRSCLLICLYLLSLTLFADYDNAFM